MLKYDKKNMKNKDRYYAKEVTEILGIYKRTIFNWEVAGKIPKASSKFLD